MKKLITFITLLCLFLPAVAQLQPYGIVDTTDLRLKSCEFEKDARAEILIDHCIANFSGHVLVLEHHLRLKIFDLSGSSSLGDISIEQPNNGQIRFMSDLRAETINLNNGKIEISEVDKKLFYKQKVDKWTSKTTFTFPNIKNGSVLEYAYKETYNWATHIPNWYFQSDLPVRYSEYDIKATKNYNFRHKFYFAEHVMLNSDSVVAMANVPSLAHEPFMDTYHGNLQRVSFPVGNSATPPDTWEQISSRYIFGVNDGQQLKIKLKNEDVLINAVKDVPPRQKIAYLFKKIRDTLSVDDEDIFYDNIGKAWNRKKGSRQQINIILCRLLEQAGLNANLVLVSADQDDRIYIGDPSLRNLDEMLVYAKLGDEVYVLDASDKDGKWNEIPYYALNTYGLYLDVNNPSYQIVFIEDKNKARNAVFVNAEILPNGKMTGTAQITNASYNRVKVLKKYKEDGEKKFSDALRQNDNNLKIASFKIENTEIDTLPLVQNIEFTYNAPDADGDYLYINPRLFSTLESDPFISKERVSNIDFVYRNNFTISGRYKIPQGYKVDALPKNISMLMPDSSIRFKQMAAEEDGFINVRWLVDYNKSYFTRDEYPSLYDFFRKMFDMLSGQIVLKKN